VANRRVKTRTGNRRLVALCKILIIFLLCLPWLIALAFGITLVQQRIRHQAEIRRYDQSILEARELATTYSATQDSEDTESPELADKDETECEDEICLIPLDEDLSESPKSPKPKPSKKCQPKQKTSTDKKSPKKDSSEKKESKPEDTPNQPEEPSQEPTTTLDPYL